MEDNPLKDELTRRMAAFLIENDDAKERPKGLACDSLERMMADAAFAVYEASHAGAVKQAEWDGTTPV